MIRVTVFNEFVHEKTDEKVKSIYPDGIHKALKENLSDDEITVKTVTLDDPECGLTDEVLENTDVLIWWGTYASRQSAGRGGTPCPERGAFGYGRCLSSLCSPLKAI